MVRRHWVSLLGLGSGEIACVIKHGRGLRRIDAAPLRQFGTSAAVAAKRFERIAQQVAGMQRNVIAARKQQCELAAALRPQQRQCSGLAA